LKDQRAETLAGLSWLHLNHTNVSRALRSISEPPQLLLATALSLDYETLTSKAQWPAILGRAIATRETPGETPTKRKGRAASASLCAVKPGQSASPDSDVDLVDELPSQNESSRPSTPDQPRKKGKGSRAGPNAADRLCASSPGPTAPIAPLPAMPDTYCDSAETCALADALCLQPRA
jgi:hypothetical protein